MKKNKHLQFKKTLLANAAFILFSPCTAYALDLNQAPPGTVQPYVRPNVIISLDDSGSMAYRLDAEARSDDKKEIPNADGSWPNTRKRINVLKYAMQSIFDTTNPRYDSSLLPNGKIRLAWLTMNGGGSTPIRFNYDDKGTPNTSTNSMKVMDDAHRTNFLNFINNLTANGGTPSHQLFSRVDAYMRAPLHKNGPWASDPGNTAAPYLGCRRNYHVMMTDGRWNGNTYHIGNLDRRDDATDINLPDNTVYGGKTAADIAKTNLYRDAHTLTLADWAFYSWGTRLQTAVDSNGMSGLKGSIQPTADYDRAPATENFGKDSQGKDAILERYWNPKYNPANWPHLVTYTIGFSNMAVTWPGAKTIQAPSNKVPFGYDGSFPDLVTGKETWPAMNNENKRSLDLWHAALNGRGRFYAIEKGEDLEKAFREILGQINTQTDPDMTSTATSGSNNTRYDVGKFTGNYEPKNDWKGFITAETIRTDGSIISNPGWGGKNTSQKIDAANISSRFILTWNDKWDSTKYKGGTLFKWTSDEKNLSTAQKLWLQKKSDGSGTDEGDTKGQERLNYIRGDRSKEGSESRGYTSTKPYRERQSAQGDVINSIIWYTGTPSSNYALPGYSDFTRNRSTRTPMIYAGGNDGMLHGFSVENGSEKIAYVPQGVIPSLTRLTEPSYNKKHRSFVDGSPITGDIYTGSNITTDSTPESKWATYLVGTLGAGGKGYYVLDVTDPHRFIDANASSLVKLDRTRSTDSAMGAVTPNCALNAMSTAEQAACNHLVAEDRDIGNITAMPVLDENNAMRTTQIARMNNNRWAAILGNGYNSANQRPVLLIQYLDGDMALKRIPATSDAAGTGKAKDNGLQAPRLVDLNGDSLPDIAYAGDNLGNLWKFDLTSENANNWGVAFSGQPLFTATGPSALGSARTVAQPISAPPTVRANDRKMNIGTPAQPKTIAVGGMMVAFGTGRNVTKTDESDRNVQTIYSVLDNTRYTRISTTLGARLQVNAGNTNCTISDGACIPAPKSLGTSVTAAKLAEQKITDISSTNANATLAAKDANNKLSTSTWKNYNGWYMDLPAVGERQLKPIEFYDSSNLLVVYSQVPAKGSDVDPNIESCESSSVDAERQYRTLINIMDGAPPSVQIVDANGDGFYNALDLNVSRTQVSKGSHTLITRNNKIADIDTKNKTNLLARMPEQSLRPNWRQLR